MKNYLLVFLLLAALLSACNLPVVSKSAQPDLAQTITAQALIIQNGNTQAGQTSAAPAAIQPAATLTLTQQAAAGSNNSVTTTPTLTLTPAPSQTGTPGVVMVSVTTDTNCRSGPGPVYPPTGVLLVGQNAVVTAKNTSSNYWIIKNAQAPGTTCWLWGQYAVINGDPSKLPEAAIPPTPTPTVTPTITPTITPTRYPPAAPVNLDQSTLTCIKNANPSVDNYYTINGFLVWGIGSNNVRGFNIYIHYDTDPTEDILLTTVGPTVTGVPYSIHTPSTIPHFELKVEAFNRVGTSERVALDVPLPNCPP